MVKFKTFIAIIIFLLLSFLFDSQISLLLGDLLPRPFLFSSHMSLIILLYLEKRFSSPSLYFSSFLLGLVADSYFFHTVGLTVFIYPLLVYLVKRHSGLLEMGFPRFLMFLTLILLSELGAYGFANIYGLTKYPIDFEINYHLIPTLVFNSMLYVLIHPLFKTVTEKN